MKRKITHPGVFGGFHRSVFPVDNTFAGFPDWAEFEELKSEFNA